MSTAGLDVDLLPMTVGGSGHRSCSLWGDGVYHRISYGDGDTPGAVD